MASHTHGKYGTVFFDGDRAHKYNKFYTNKVSKTYRTASLIHEMLLFARYKSKYIINPTKMYAHHKKLRISMPRYISIMEYIKTRIITSSTMVKWFLQLNSVLLNLKKYNIVLMDIRAPNILISEKEDAVFIDLGLSYNTETAKLNVWIYDDEKYKTYGAIDDFLLLYHIFFELIPEADPIIMYDDDSYDLFQRVYSDTFPDFVSDTEVFYEKYKHLFEKYDVDMKMEARYLEVPAQPPKELSCRGNTPGLIRYFSREFMEINAKCATQVYNFVEEYKRSQQKELIGSPDDYKLACYYIMLSLSNHYTLTPLFDDSVGQCNIPLHKVVVDILKTTNFLLPELR